MNGWTRLGLSLLLIGRASAAAAQSLRPRVTLRSAAWSSSRTLDDRAPLVGSVVWGEVTPRLFESLDVRAAARIGVGSVSGASEMNATVRELYADATLGALGLRLGKQIIAWGRADAINPTDNLSPRDYTLLVPDDDDQRSGVPAARVSLTLDATTVSAFWLADFRAHTLPLGALPPGVRFVWRPRGDVAAQGAVRLERSGGRVDWSLSYFNGYDLMPDIASRTTGGAPTVEFRYHRLRVLGADAATVLGRYGVRIEGAWIDTEDRTGADPEIKNGTLFVVLGADRTFGGYLNFNVQYLVRWVRDFHSPSTLSDPAQRATALLLARVTQQLRGVQHGITYRISNRWWHETLEAEVSGMVLSPPAQVVIRPRASYALTDRWHVEIGGDFFEGQVETQFHALRKNAVAFLELRLGL